MKIVREDLVNGSKTIAARYSNVTTTTASAFMNGLARSEAIINGSVETEPHVLSGRAVATVSQDGKPIARYRMEF